MIARARKPTPQRRIGGQARRAQILRAASAVFARDGIEHTSMRKIAAEAGVAATLLYKHFADKEALLMAIGEGFFVKLAGYLDEATKNERDPVAQLRARMRAYVKCGIENPREYHLTFMTALPGLKRGKALKAFREKMRQGKSVPEDEITMGMRCFARLESAVAAVVDAKATRVKDVPLLAEAVWSSGHGLVSLLITHGDFGWSESERLIDTCLDMALHGLLKD